VAGDTLPLRKPDPAPLHHAFTALGGPGIYVGDSEVDAATAQAAGAPFVLFTRGIRMTPVEAIPHDVAFEDFAALPEICERLTKAKGAP
jgi:phosphoglycolate phosphatase